MLGLDAGFCRRYLTNIIRFDLGPRELAGLHHYYMLASELGLARRGVQVRLLPDFGHQESGSRGHESEARSQRSGEVGLSSL